ncbi:hypothetical protein TPHA_0P00640 [Tetrapisispora phaffii CBS 4417]|uniref:non-specific serine/threonine protein kinase n=1 Tax=Tetrapisispora phaffii (strain ATCC 24235 / CBS 4417 / NBRC 1672 / NRRL Y-8282 / UCD 70-5) TaxID=1071381 RepID=G8C244_TETPH|nr:hypothetical protein TPHA_0P00640 [Tetrapisispora phaffii CBS 4417]CCE66222.1 hypothetical protein TPHA_0P00640 [Tetrapisispora phaffii CBS 4417]
MSANTKDDEGSSNSNGNLSFKHLSEYLLHPTQNFFHNSSRYVTNSNNHNQVVAKTLSITSNTDDTGVNELLLNNNKYNMTVHPAQHLQNTIKMQKHFSNLHGNGNTPSYRISLTSSGSTVAKVYMKNIDSNGKKKYSKGKETLHLKRFIKNHSKNETFLENLNRNLSNVSHTSNSSFNSLYSDNNQTEKQINSKVITRISSVLSNTSIATTNSDNKQHHSLNRNDNYYGIFAFTDELTNNFEFKMLTSEDTIDTLLRFYGQPIKKVGEGASGTVNVLKNYERQKLYAVKILNSNDIPVPQQNNSEGEPANYPNRTVSKREYAEKVTAEYSIGSTLHHLNLIKILGMIQMESIGMYYLIMEFAQHDFFDVIMSDNLQVDSINCYFKQICNGVQYLHSMGISHRDLKLDNCVVNHEGTLKIIDFGCAVIFNDDLNSDKCVKAFGITGSDPYLAPELLNTINRRASNGYYDPRAVDVWSLAIIYYCMVVKKFPWKSPKLMYNSFRLFCSIPQYPNDSLMGPYRLLKYLPEESRPLLREMIKIDPLDRIPMNEIVKERWFQSIVCCTENPASLHYRSAPYRIHSHDLRLDIDYTFS